MTIGVLRERGVSQRAIARQLWVHEKRYRLKRLATQARDQRADQLSSVASHAEAVAQWMASAGAGGMNGLALYEWLVAEHAFYWELRSIVDYERCEPGSARGKAPCASWPHRKRNGH